MPLRAACHRQARAHREPPDRRNEMDPKPIKIGLIAELTGPLSFMGIANANLTTMLVDDINARAACWAGRWSSSSRMARPPTASPRQGRETDRRRQGRPGRRRHLQLDPPGHQERGRHAGQDALHLHRAVRGTGIRSPDLLHRPGARAAGRAADPMADEAAPGRRNSTCRRPTTSGRIC